MKTYLLALSLVLGGCATHTNDEYATWRKVENLSGEALVAALADSGDSQLAEMRERQRNLRLEIESLEPEAAKDPEKENNVAVKTAIYNHLEELMNERALQRKMELWKAVQKKKE